MLESNYKPTHRVFMFSGGATSAYMVLRYYKAGDLVVFADTGREHQKTYEFIDNFERHSGIEILRTSYKGSSNAFSQLIADKKYKVLPNLHRRFCTIELKIKPIKKLLKSMGILQFTQVIGFRYDEPDRVLKRKNEYKKVVDEFPMYHDRVIKSDIDNFWLSMPYRLEVPRILGNCTLCFMKGKNAILRILASHPELASPWVYDELRLKDNKPSGVNTYLHGVSIAQLLKASESIQTLNFPMDEVEPAYKCACTM